MIPVAKNALDNSAFSLILMEEVQSLTSHLRKLISATFRTTKVWTSSDKHFL